MKIEWKKLTNEQIEKFRFSTYEGEIILIDSRRPSEYEERFYFNAQEFFSEEYLDNLGWYES
jgi:hypothetical protein